MPEGAVTDILFDHSNLVWDFGASRPRRFRRGDLDVALFGTIAGLRDTVGDGWSPFDEERLLDLIAGKGTQIALFCDGVFALVWSDRAGGVVANDFFGGFRLFYRVGQGGTRFLSALPPGIAPAPGTVSASLLERKGYTDGAETGVPDLRKTLGGEALALGAHGVERRNILIPGQLFFPDTGYAKFRALMKAELDHKLAGVDHAIIQFSGGVDSMMIARFARLRDVRRTLLNMAEMSGGRSLDEAGARRARAFAERWGETFRGDQVDCEHLPPETERLVGRIDEGLPFVRHHMRTIAALAVASAGLARPGETAVVLNGQNADSVASLGPTEGFRPSPRGILSGGKGLLSRAFLYVHNRGWLSGAPGWLRRLLPLQFRSEAHFLLAFHYTAMGYLALLSERRWRRLFPDVAFAPFLDAFQKRLAREYPGYAPQEIMYNLKLKMFLQGGDMHVVLKAHELAGVPLAMPFKSIDLFLFFMEKKMTLGDVIAGKRYVKRFAREMSAAQVNGAGI